MIRAHITRRLTDITPPRWTGYYTALAPDGWAYRVFDTNARWTLAAGACPTQADALDCACRHIHAAHLGLNTEPIGHQRPLTTHNE